MMSNRLAGTIKRTGAKSVVAAWFACAYCSAIRPPLGRVRCRSKIPTPRPSRLLPPSAINSFPSQRSGGVSREQARRDGARRFQGRVVSARTSQMGERTVHEIRILGDDNQRAHRAHRRADRLVSLGAPLMRLLLVEDDPNLSRSLAAQLEQAGYSVEKVDRRS